MIPSAPLASRSCQLTLIALGLDLLAEEVLRAVGAEGIERRSQISKPGLAIHEVGTARMGDDPKTSVVNRWQQAHDVSNLFVMDGAVYPSSPVRTRRSRSWRSPRARATTWSRSSSEDASNSELPKLPTPKFLKVGGVFSGFWELVFFGSWELLFWEVSQRLPIAHSIPLVRCCWNRGSRHTSGSWPSAV